MKLREEDGEEGAGITLEEAQERKAFLEAAKVDLYRDKSLSERGL